MRMNDTIEKKGRTWKAVYITIITIGISPHDHNNRHGIHYGVCI